MVNGKEIFVSGTLDNLEILVPYPVKKLDGESSGINELASIHSLRVLQITNLENVTGLEDARSAELRSKQHLRQLSLNWEEEGEEADIPNSVMVLEGLEPPPYLEKLVIENFGGGRFPEWMGMGSSYMHCLPNLVELYISYCNSCEKLPALGMLPSLRVLWIAGMRSIKRLGQEFYHPEEESTSSNSVKATPTTILFPSLTRLELGDMDNLEEWTAPPPPYTSFPVLEILCIIGCCELTLMPDFRSCTSLREVTVEECDKLNKECYDFIPKEDQSDDDSSKEYEFPNSISIDRYLVMEITSGTLADSGIQDIAALETGKCLHIKNLENVRGGKEGAERAMLKNKKHIEDLYLSWNSSSSNDDYDDDEWIDRNVNDGMVLEGLQPHPNLKILKISGFRGLKLPKWMGLPNYLPHLVRLYFYSCDTCRQLPALGMLPCLSTLQIKEMSLVRCLGQEFYYPQQESSGSSTNREIKIDESEMEKPATTTSSSPRSSGILSVFPSLVELSLTDMPMLDEWAAPHYSFESFPSLESLIISGCLRLRSIPLSSCSSLKSLELHNTNDESVNSILASTGGEISLESVSIQYSPHLVFFPVVLLPSHTRFQSLEIAHCPNFQGFRILDNDEFNAQVSSDTGGFNTSISSLCSLKLFDCRALKCVPNLREWSSLTKLWIKDCKKLKDSFSYDLASLPSLQTLYVDRSIDLHRE